MAEILLSECPFFVQRPLGVVARARLRTFVHVDRLQQGRGLGLSVVLDFLEEG
jgi:hypothetical protein